MRNSYVAIGLALCSTNALAADFGLGVSARSNDGMLYVPVDISKSFRIEPSVRYASSDAPLSAGLGSSGGETETLEVGMGVFGVKRISEAAHFYFGARFAYVEATTDYPGFTFSSKLEQDGYRIGPAAGFEYVFGQHFSVGGEANYTFLDMDAETRASYGTIDGTSESKGQATQTRLIFRYMF